MSEEVSYGWLPHVVYVGGAMITKSEDKEWKETSKYAVEVYVMAVV